MQNRREFIKKSGLFALGSGLGLTSIVGCRNDSGISPFDPELLVDPSKFWRFESVRVKDNEGSYNLVERDNCLRVGLPSKFYQSTEIIDLKFNDLETAEFYFPCYGAGLKSYWVFNEKDSSSGEGSISFFGSSINFDANLIDGKNNWAKGKLAFEIGSFPFKPRYAFRKD